MLLEQLECLLRAVSPLHQTEIDARDRAPVLERLELQDLIPILRPVKNDLDLLGKLLGLHQGENLEELVERTEAARKNDQRLGQIRKPEFAHEEVMELEMQSVGDERI